MDKSNIRKSKKNLKIFIVCCLGSFVYIMLYQYRLNVFKLSVYFKFSNETKEECFIKNGWMNCNYFVDQCKRKGNTREEHIAHEHDLIRNVSNLRKQHLFMELFCI